MKIFDRCGIAHLAFVRLGFNLLDCEYFNLFVSFYAYLFVTLHPENEKGKQINLCGCIKYYLK